MLPSPKNAGTEMTKNKRSMNGQYSTFRIAGRLYGIDVIKVQEIVKPMPITKIPLSVSFIRGLINLRGQVATAIDLRELFGLSDAPPEAPMNVVCRCDGALISLLVDDIGDVIEVTGDDYEETPKTIPASVRVYMSGVYKLKNALLSIIDIEKLFTQVNRP